MKYSDLLAQYAVRKDVDVDRRKKKEEQKVLSRSEYIEALNDFCKPEDLVGVTATMGCVVFNRYLKEHGKPLTGRNTFSRMVKETFGMKSRLVNTGHGDYANVFVIDDARQR